VRDLGVVGVQGNVIGGRENCVLDHSWILTLELHCFKLCLTSSRLSVGLRIKKSKVIVVRVMLAMIMLKSIEFTYLGVQ